MIETPQVLSETPGASDLLSDLLGSMHLSGVVLLRTEFREPWALLTPDACQMARLLLNLKPARRRVPFQLAFYAGLVLEGVHRLLPFLGEPLVTRFLASELYRNHYFSTRNAERDFGYRPLVSFAEAESRTLAWFSDWLKSRPA